MDSIMCAGPNHSSPISPFQGDTQAWDIQVHDQRIKEATEKARQETFGEDFLSASLWVQDWVSLGCGPHFFTVYKNIFAENCWAGM